MFPSYASILALYISLHVLLLSNVFCAEPTCNQDLLDRSFVTQCGPHICEPLLENGHNNRDSQRLNEWPSNKDEVIHIVSSRDGPRFKVNSYKAIDTTEFYYEDSHVNGTIFVDTKVKYQRILGFGTTLTDAACTNVDSLPDDIREKLITDYFGTENGIGLNLIKVPIGSTKYSYSNYVLDQPDSNQVELSPYDIDHRIPIIRDAMKAAGRFKNRVKILASSATAPGEFKDNNQIIHGGYLKQDKYHDYASYLASFLTAYKVQGFNIWSLILSEKPVTVAQNKEPNESLDYNSMAMKPSHAIKLIRAISELRNSKQMPSADLTFRMLLLGDGHANIPVWADGVFKSEEAAKNVAGVAYTCESSSQVAPYDNLAYVNRRYPNKYLLATQGSTNTPIKLGNWQYGENYATEIVKNLEFGSVGWIDFNMALDLDGGPFIIDKFRADAPVMIDAKRGIYYRNPMFYAIGHISRYVKPGSIRVKINFYSSAHMYASQYIAFLTPDNYLVVFVANNNIGPMPISIGIDTSTRVEPVLDTKSFNTFIFRL